MTTIIKIETTFCLVDHLTNGQVFDKPICIAQARNRDILSCKVCINSPVRVLISPLLASFSSSKYLFRFQRQSRPKALAQVGRAGLLAAQVLYTQCILYLL